MCVPGTPPRPGSFFMCVPQVLFLRSSGEHLRPGSFFMCVPGMPARFFSYVPREPPKAVGQRRKGVKSQRNQANPAIRCFPQPPFWRPLASPQRPGSFFPTFLGPPVWALSPRSFFMSVPKVFFRRSGVWRSRPRSFLCAFLWARFKFFLDSLLYSA